MGSNPISFKQNVYNIKMYLNIIFLPFLGCFFSGIFGRFLSSKGASIITVFSIGFTSFLCFFCFYDVAFCGCFCYIKINCWLNSENFFTNWGFYFDTLTVIMLVVVTFISTLVHLYSIEYMSHDPHLIRFMVYLSLFTAFMIILVTADNYLQMFLGWEGIGLSSYLLINFWFTRIQANKAAIKAMIINRIGDFSLAMALFLIYLYFQSLDYSVIFCTTNKLLNEKVTFFFINANIITIISFLLFVGAVGKSAQLGLHTWLPDAMEGPTPVSALIHAATLVTAGVFLIIRSSPIIEHSQYALTVIIIIGALTAFLAASIGLVQNDLKRVIAYSTCSQLGYMVFSCGVSNYYGALFHLANHAFFKALLFLAAGAIIHGINDEQDMRKMGGLKKIIPFTYAMIFIGSFSLMGFPFLTGYYSKDFILECAYSKFTISAHFSFVLGTVAAFFTAFYSTRLLFLTFLSEPNGFKNTLKKTHESSFFITIPLSILAIPSIFIGYFFHDMFIGMGSDFFGNGIFLKLHNFKNIEAEFLSIKIKIIPVIFSILGSFFAFYLFDFKKKNLYIMKRNKIGLKTYTFLNRKWFFDKIYNEIILQKLFFFSYNISYKMIDRGLIEKLGPLGFSEIILLNSKMLQKIQSGYIYHYTFFIFIGLGSFMTFSLFVTNFIFDLNNILFIFLAIFISNVNKK